MRGLVPTWWIVTDLVVCVAGVALLVASGSDGTAGVIGFALLGLGAVVGTAVAFYAVGRSEDRDRERGRA